MTAWVSGLSWYAGAMARRDSFLTTRRLLIGLFVFGLFVVFDIALFGYLIFDSLSEREIEEVLLQTREQAEPVARELEERAAKTGQDIWVVMSMIEETQTYVGQALQDRTLVRKVEVRDPAGRTVYEEFEEQPVAPVSASSSMPAVEAGPEADGLDLPPGAIPRFEEVVIPIGDLGTLVIGVSEEHLQQRIEVLREDLIQQASLIGILTIILLAVAALAIWLLFLRGRQLEDQALESERMAYIGTLASGLAHEIRNPLNALSLNMQMLDEEAQSGGLGGSSGRLLTITQSEISRLERLVTDFLSYARPRSAAMETVVPRELFETARSILASEIQARGAVVEVEDRSEGAEVRVDREQIRQLLLNLMQNALQATERVDRTPQLRLVARRQAGWVALEVSDNGIGLSENARRRMFEIFYSTRKGGTGLGLAIVQRIAKAHDGRIEAASIEGQGTTIRLLLPRVGASRSVTQTLTLPIVDA